YFLVRQLLPRRQQPQRLYCLTPAKFIGLPIQDQLLNWLKVGATYAREQAIAGLRDRIATNVECSFSRQRQPANEQGVSARLAPFRKQKGGVAEEHAFSRRRFLWVRKASLNGPEQWFDKRLAMSVRGSQRLARLRVPVHRKFGQNLRGREHRFRGWEQFLRERKGDGAEG